MADLNQPPHPYSDQEYQQSRKTALGIIPRSNFLSAISRNAGMINGTLTSVAIAAIVVGTSTIPLWGILTLIGIAVGAAVVSAYAAYQDEKMSKTVGLEFSEAKDVAIARLNGKELAKAMNETMGAKIDALGEEVGEVQKENYQTQQSIAALQQKMANWRERETAKEEKPRTRP